MFRYTAWLFCQIQDNASPNRCIFNSIGQQIDKDLAQAHRVSQKMSMIDPVNMDLKLLSPFFCLWTDDTVYLCHLLHQINGIFI